jgi:hypothetical protein
MPCIRIPSIRIPAANCPRHRSRRSIHTSYNVARRLPLEAIAEAHEIVERGEVMGNVVVDIP